MTERNTPSSFRSWSDRSDKMVKLMSFSANPLSVLPETELFEPVRNLLHWGAPVATDRINITDETVAVNVSQSP